MTEFERGTFNPSRKEAGDRRDDVLEDVSNTGKPSTVRHLIRATITVKYSLVIQKIPCN